MSARLKPAASLEEIARAEGISIGATRMLLTRALRKLRREGLLTTARALAAELERNRNSEHSVYRRNGRRAGAE